MDASTSYSGSSHRSRRRRRYNVTDREEFLLWVILPVIGGQSCPIYLATLEDRRAAVITNFLHGYCAGCIRTWSDIRQNCPLCNAEVGSWLFGTDLHRRCFHAERLPPLGDEHNRVEGSDGSNRSRRL